ncbi:hypothetical protein H5410_027073 [Solanum commersonii]|uniref:Ribonuclease H1 N-terminal domain-containing protein n=1 Tax=Solanum commersonii TaxID=4109 RepID=A0A9J5Z099_SOLCO|nr:hypothetical protein H5410_027073 [Solanum commersonii]
MKRLYFGKQNLIFYPPSNLSFRVKPETKIDKPQRCLIDNLWIAYNKIPRDNSYFISVVNSLSHYFIDKNEDKKFRFYVVVQGRLLGVFQPWIEVIDSIKDFPTPLFKGFNDFNEELDYARGILGPNYFISPALRQTTRPFLQYNIQKDTDKIIFCDHCSSMTEGFRRLNQTIEKLETEKEKLTLHIHSLQERIKFLLGNTNQTILLQIQDNSEKPKSSPSQSKMDKTGVHFPKNVERAIVLAKGTASPVQMVVGKDSSNPLIADTLPKSVRILPASFNTVAETSKKTKGFLQKRKKNKRIEKIIKSSLYKLLTEKTKEVIHEKIIRETPEPDPANSELEDTRSSSDENNLSIDQFTQHYDPNEDNDSGMSLDSVALHNLDT